MQNITKYRHFSGAITAFIVAMTLFSCNPAKYVPDNEYLLNKYKLNCDNNKLDLEELDSYVKQKPNRRMLQAVRFHLSVYNFFYSHKAKKIRRKIAEIVGEEPVIYDEFLKDKSVKQMKIYLRNKGYYQAEVTDSVHFRRKKANIIYTVHTNTPYRLGKISYSSDDYAIEAIVCSDTAGTLLKKGNLFDVDILQAERERITKMMKNRGYYYFSKEYIHYDADSSIGNHQVDVNVRVKNFMKRISDQTSIETKHEKYTIGKVYFYTDYDPKEALSEGNKYFERYDTLILDNYYFLYAGDIAINPRVILQANYLQENNLYTDYDAENTYNQLMSLKVFKIINIQFLEPSGENEGNLLDCHVQLTPMNRQSYTVELEGTNSSGNFGIAGSYKYQHKSTFRNAEIFDFKVRGGFERQTTMQNDRSDEGLQEYLAFNTLELGGETSLNIPKFWFISGNKNYGFTKKYNPKNIITIAYNFQRRPKYTRTIANLSYGYYWNSSKHLKHIVTPFEVNMVDIPVIDSAFYNEIQNPYIRNSYKNYLITSTTYSLIFTNQDIKKQRSFSYLRINLEPAGNLLSTINKITKVTNEGGSYLVLNRKYAQYSKADLDFRYYQILSTTNKLVYRFFAGAGVPYGNSTALPFVKQYFAGGANSIRAWPVRDLGPGSYDSDETFNYQTADMKIEMNLEYRFKWFWMVEGALFIDAGNIWAVSPNDNREGALFRFNSFYDDIAIGSGFGMRFDFSFFVFRFDFGVKVRDPIQIEGEKIVIFTERSKFMKDLFNNVNVGIGYPF